MPDNILLQLAVIILAVKGAGALSRRCQQPAIFGQLMAGVVLGPSVLNVMTANAVIHGFAEIGVVLLMFIAGLETDLHKIKETGAAPLLSALGGIVLPLAGGIGLGLFFGMELTTAIFLGITLTATSVSISVETLRQLGRLQSKEGFTILGAAVLDDIIGIINLSLLLGIMAGAANEALALLIVKMILFLLGSWLVGLKLIPKVFNWADRLGATVGLIALGICFCFALAYLSKLGGLASITGAYLAGLIIKESGLGTIMHREVESLNHHIFLPVFLFNIGISAEISQITNILGFVVLLVLVAVTTKVVGGALGAKIGGFSLNSAITVGAGLVSRGEIALVMASLGLSTGIIQGQMFASLVMMVLVTTLLTPLMLKAIVR